VTVSPAIEVPRLTGSEAGLRVVTAARLDGVSSREDLNVGRNIVLCLDGTNNKYAAVNTNVVKLYAMLDKKSDQLSYYQPGIGTFAPPGTWGNVKRKVITRLDLAIAWLLEEHVSDAYRFLMRYYEEGDRIFLFGFSRGAYTARVLAAMLSAPTEGCDPERPRPPARLLRGPIAHEVRPPRVWSSTGDPETPAAGALTVVLAPGLGWAAVGPK
jgi:hypothetical protein